MDKRPRIHYNIYAGIRNAIIPKGRYTLMENLMVYVWIGLAVAFLIVEALTPQLVTIWFALGSSCALLLSAFRLPLWLQICTFVAVSAVLLLIFRPYAKKFNKNTEKTNAQGLIGCTGIVTEAIDNINGAGRIKIEGLSWAARSQNGETVEAGTRVKVLDISGVKLIVTTEI